MKKFFTTWDTCLKETISFDEYSEFLHNSKEESILNNDQHENELENVETYLLEKICNNQSHLP